MEPETVTIEVDVSTAAILRALEEKANAQGVTLDALLQELIKESEIVKEPIGQYWSAATKRRDFMKLSLDERRRIMKSQAKQLIDEYAHAGEREVWQGGDFVES